MDENPELLEKTIEQGDILAHVLGKERNGYVRGIGLGPSAGTLRMLGAQKLKSTKLQMAELEAKQAWQANELLREEVDDMRVDTKAQIDVLLEEVKLLRGMVVQSNAGNNKSSMHHIDTEPADSVGESAAANEQYSFHDVNIDEEDIMEQELREAQEQFERKKAEEALLRKKKEAARIQNRDATQRQKEQQELLQKRKEAKILQKKRKESELRQNEEELQNKEAELKKKEAELQKKKKAAEVQKKKEAEAQKKKQQAAITQENHQQGSEVILYSVFRDHDTAVAKGTILSTDRKKMVGGWELGVECCEVVINYIIKGDAILFRPVGNMKKMGQAQGRSIAWLYKHLEVEQKSKAKAASLPQVD